MTSEEIMVKAEKESGKKICRDPSGVLRDCTSRSDEQNIFSAPVWEPSDEQLLEAMLAIYRTKAEMSRSLKQTPQTINHWFNTEGRVLPIAWRMYFLQQIRKVTHDN